MNDGDGEADGDGDDGGVDGNDMDDFRDGDDFPLDILKIPLIVKFECIIEVSFAIAREETNGDAFCI